MNKVRRRISLLLCALMVVTTVFTVAPEEFQASNYHWTVNNKFGSGQGTFEAYVYEGAENLYMGDFCEAFKHENPGTPNYKITRYGSLTGQKGVTYKSSKKSVATIDKNGLVKIKKTGTTTITVKFQGWTCKTKLKVISKKKFDKIFAKTECEVNVKKLEKAAKTLLKKTGKIPTIKKSNRYKLLSAYKTYETYLKDKVYDYEVYADPYGYDSGYVRVESYNSKTGNWEGDYCIFSPITARARQVSDAIATYGELRNPFETYRTNCFKIKSISGKAKTNKITVKLTQKVTAEQIFGAQCKYSKKSEVKEVTKYSFPIVVRNTSTGKKYNATATIKKGSATMTIVLKDTKLKKGKKYELIARTTKSYDEDEYEEDYLGNWLDNSANKNSFKAK